MPILTIVAQIQRERAVSPLLSDEKRGKESFPSDAGEKKRKTGKALMLSADLVFYTSSFSGVSRGKKRLFEMIFEDVSSSW